MLAAPMKKGKSADWASPLRSYLVRTYGEKTADEQTESLSKLNQSREWVLSNKRGDDGTLENIKTYLRMIGTVEARFPVREGDVNMNFTWYDSFKPTKKFTHHRIEAERASILFNYAAMESYAGMSQDRSLPDGLVQACEHFRFSARYFQYLRDIYIPEKMSGPVTSDLSFDGLSMLTNLMLAQAQACFFEKAVRNKMKASILAKLAAGAKDLYTEALKFATGSNLNTIIDPSWAIHLTFQQQCFDASARYQYSKMLAEKSEETGEGFGMRIAFLQSSLAKCNEAVSTAVSKELPQAMLSTIEGLKTVVEKDLKRAIEDNNTIYMDLIPQVSALPNMEAHLLAKSEIDKVDPALVGPILPGSGGNESEPIFKDLLPAEVQIAVAMFKSRLTDMSDKVKKSVDEANERVRSALAGANLPAVIEAGDGSTRGLPDDTYSKILEVVHHKGGVMGLKAALYSNAKLAENLQNILRGCQEALRQDEELDTAKRNIWAASWNLPVAAEANSFIRKDCARFNGYLQEARESDKLLLSKIEDPKLKTLLDDVSMEKAGLDLLMPDPGKVDDDPVVENLRSNLRMSYIKLQSNLQDSESKLEDLKYMFEKDNIVRELYVKDMSISDIVGNEAKLKTIIDKKMETYEDPVSEIETTIENHTSLLARVLDDTTKYMASRRENKAMREREAALARIEHGIEEFEKLSKHIEEGKSFYASLTAKVNRLQTTVNDHCYSRQMLSKDLENVLIRSVEDNKFNSMNSSNVNVPVMTPYPMNSYQNYTNFTQGQGPQYQQQRQPGYNPNGFGQQQVGGQKSQQTQNFGLSLSPGMPVQNNQQGGLSLYEEMQKAQLSADSNQLNMFAGTNVTDDNPVNSGAMDDQALLQAEVVRQQQEALDAIRLNQFAKDIGAKDYKQELQQMKLVVGDGYSDKVLLEYIKGADGNVEVAMNHLLEGGKLPDKAKKGFGGIFSRKKKEGGPAKPKKANNNYEW